MANQLNTTLTSRRTILTGMPAVAIGVCLAVSPAIAAVPHWPAPIRITR